MQDLVDQLGKALVARGIMLAVAESCTGGLLAATITHRAGASKFFDRGFITYSNAAKTQMLGVDPEDIHAHGAVSPEVAEAMARGALKHSGAGLAVSITGIAGPGGESFEKPVGLVYFGYALRGGSSGTLKHNFSGNREQIQTAATITALKHLISVLEEE